METKNIMIVGVGGQGTLLTSRGLGGLAIAGGYDVKLSEVHGMAQRGGSVVTFVRYGENVAEPIVEEGQAGRGGKSGPGDGAGDPGWGNGSRRDGGAAAQ